MQPEVKQTDAVKPFLTWTPDTITVEIPPTLAQADRDRVVSLVDQMATTPPPPAPVTGTVELNDTEVSVALSPVVAPKLVMIEFYAQNDGFMHARYPGDTEDSTADRLSGLAIELGQLSEVDFLRFRNSLPTSNVDNLAEAAETIKAALVEFKKKNAS